MWQRLDLHDEESLEELNTFLCHYISHTFQTQELVLNLAATQSFIQQKTGPKKPKFKQENRLSSFITNQNMEEAIQREKEIHGNEHQAKEPIYQDRGLLKKMH